MSDTAILSPDVLPPPITSKRQMYSLLSRGSLGNTIRQFFSLHEWEQSSDYAAIAVWGVRTLTPGGPCRLYCPSEEVKETVEQFRAAGHEINISCMIDAICNVTLYADILDSPTGLVVRAVEYPGKGASWRKAMPERGVDYHGLTAKMLLRRHLNECDLADLEALQERWPGHVVELSACDRCIGQIPGRQSIIWECRRY